LLTEQERLPLLTPPAGPVRMVLDTDTYNEIDDQFALTYALLSPERLSIEAVYAAPFHNDRSRGPADGMQKSYEEIGRVLDRLHHPTEGFAYLGATTWLSETGQPLRTPAAEDLIARALRPAGDPLYVVAIGAPTNIAAALLIEPAIAQHMVVVWLGGNARYWPTAREFNLQQDPAASRLMFDSGVALVHVPCLPVTDHLSTTQAEMDRFVRDQGAIGAYLSEIYAGYYDDHYARSKVIWDIGPVAWLVEPDWTDSALVASPLLSSELTWSHDPHRHLIREVQAVQRDPIFADLFRKLERTAAA
jgi:inosine-uridine nucleoside N-ribohydrolase